MKDLIVGCITGYNFEQIKPWVLSIDRCGFKGDKAMVVYNCDYHTYDALVKHGFMVLAFKNDAERKRFHYSDNFGPQIVVTRFLHLWSMMCKLKEGDYRYVITTDVKDVIFQTNPSEWLESNIGDKLLNAASESLPYRHENWSNVNMLNSFGREVHEYMSEKGIYNAGTIAGRFAAIRDLCLNVYLMSRYNPVHNPDQSALNILLTLEPYRSVTKFCSSEDGWACQAGTTVDPLKIAAYRPHLTDPEPIFDGKYVWTAGGRKFCIVHQYDRVPAWKTIYLSNTNEAPKCHCCSGGIADRSVCKAA